MGKMGAFSLLIVMGETRSRRKGNANTKGVACRLRLFISFFRKLKCSPIEENAISAKSKASENLQYNLLRLDGVFLISAMRHIFPYQVNTKESARQEVLSSCLAFFVAFSALHDLCHKTSHGCCRSILLLPGSVGVGAEGEARIVVAQHTADRFHVYAILEGQGREYVPIGYNKDTTESPINQGFSSQSLYAFSMKQHKISTRIFIILCQSKIISVEICRVRVAKLVEAENEGILVEVENRT